MTIFFDDRNNCLINKVVKIDPVTFGQIKRAYLSTFGHDSTHVRLNYIYQGWKLALAHSPMRVSSPSGEWKCQVTRPVWRVEFSSSGK